MSDKRIQLLRHLQETKCEALTPVANVNSFCGYTFPKAQEILEVAPGEEISTLNRLAELGLFDRKPSHKIHLCPFCHNFALNFREVCPQCKSEFITPVELIHHYACGFIGDVALFEKEGGLTCPKCRASIRHMGLDYERPGSNHRCDTCTHCFWEPEVSCVSLVCGQSFEVDRAVVHTLFSYHITERGTSVAWRGSMDSVESRPTLHDSEFNMYSTEFFLEAVTRELGRTSRYPRPFSVLLLKPKAHDSHIPHQKHQVPLHVFKDIANVTQQSIRNCDLISIFREEYLALLLPETSQEGASVVFNRLREKIGEFMTHTHGLNLDLAIGMVEGPATFESQDQLLTVAVSQVQDSFYDGNGSR